MRGDTPRPYMDVAGITGGRADALAHLGAVAPDGVGVSVVASTAPGAAADGLPVEGVDDAAAAAEAVAGADLVVVEDAAVSTEVLAALDATAVELVEGLRPDETGGGDGVDDAAAGGGYPVGGATVRLAGATGPAAVVAQEPAVAGPEGVDGRDAARRALVRAVRAFAADRVTVDGTTASVEEPATDPPARLLSGADRAQGLRYGENPHQDAAVYRDGAAAAPSVVDAPQLNDGAKALSYNNYNDADAALALVREFEDPAAAVIKHTNPAGAAVGESPADAYERALSTDPKSAFGGVVALNRECDAATAEQVVDSFKEVVVAPGYTDDALGVLRGSDNLRVLDVGALDADAGRWTETDLVGGRLLQERDDQRVDAADLEVVTERAPTDAQVATMCFAWQVVKHVKSNAIVFADGTETVGVGAGQVSRVDAVELAAKKAARDAEGKDADGAVMASDAFFPFPDGVEAAAEAGVEAVVQPGGSVNDDDVVEACDDLGLAMAFTGQRAFRHD